MNDLGGRRRIVARWLPQGAVGAEIGVFKGDFTLSILEHLSPTKLYLIDPWKNMTDPKFSQSLFGADGRNDMEKIFAAVKDRFSREIGEGRVVVMRGPSETELKKMDDRILDYAYVDGDHSYDGVSQDLRLIHTKIKSRGFIVLDDYGVDGWWGDGILRAAHEFLAERSAEFEVKACGNGQLILRRTT